MAACAQTIANVPDRGAIADWHRNAFRDVVPLHYYAGGYRQHDLNRVCLGVNVGVAGAMGAPFHQVLDLMNQLCDFLRQEVVDLELGWATLPAQDRVTRLAMILGTAIGRFIHIHPFRNGNGRMSRVLWAALFARFGLPPQVSIVRRPAGPYGDVMRAAMSGDYGPTVAMVLVALAQTPPSMPAPTTTI